MYYISFRYTKLAVVQQADESAADTHYRRVYVGAAVAGGCLDRPCESMASGRSWPPRSHRTLSVRFGADVWPDSSGLHDVHDGGSASVRVAASLMVFSCE